MINLLLLALCAAAPAAAAKQDVLVTVNGVAVNRRQVADRAWNRHADASLNEIIDELLISQAADSLKVKSEAGEVEARLKRIQSRFQDETTFKERLSATGSSLAALRSELEAQVLREQLVVRARALTVTDAEAQDFFNANKDKLGAPEAVHLRHILVSSEKQASDFLIALRAGADFARLAAEVSLDGASKERGGDLGLITRGMLDPDIEKVVFALAAGQVAAPVRSAGGFHLFKADEVRPAKPAAFPEVQQDLKQALLSDKIKKSWPDYLKELHSKAKIIPATSGKSPR